jgi:hypothetical protein
MKIVLSFFSDEDSSMGIAFKPTKMETGE